MTWTETLVEREPGLARIIDRVDAAGALPTIPSAAQLAIQLARDENTSMRQIAEVVAQDQALAAMVLRTVNSAYYGLRQRVGTLPLALTVLGLTEIVNILLSVAIVSAFPGGSRNPLFDREAFWRTCAQRAYSSKRLAHAVGLGRYASEAFLGGLILDIGLIVLDQYVHDEFVAMLADARDNALELSEAERRHFDTTHGSIGAWLAEAWAFPDTLTEAIASHHRPESASWDPPLTALVAVAELIQRLHADHAGLEDAAAALDADPTWQRLSALGPPVRTPTSTTEMVGKIWDEIESAPVMIGESS